eukprot:TRINITY_DN3281_c0_g1_i5.p1 TRINITY_DN3281_c0_g1~~TRINITY_DN3281_c0_g1_i5.p1  ORF type:complete len:237 (-),score=34.75 TRINITY_DN3281_c0_g1_i5:331-1041(-)
MAAENENPVRMDKILRRLEQLVNPEGPRIECFVLILSGSFNPVHRMHIYIFEACRRFIEQNGGIVLAGFVSPSSDRYVRGKLADAAIELIHRNQLCRIATADSDWLEVCEWGLASGAATTQLVGESIRDQLPPALASKVTINPIEICGADHALKYRLWRHKRMICVTRPGYEGVKQAMEEEGAVRGFLLVEADTHDISSTAIRKALQEGRASDVVTVGWMQPEVVAYLQQYVWPPL